MNPHLRVLVVDDEPDIREIAALSLQVDPDIDVRSAPSAMVAINLLTAGEWRPDVVLLDMMMADVDGLAAMTMIHELDGFTELPVIIVTARAREGDHERYREAGAVAVITKPFAPLELASQVRALLAATR